MRVIPGTVQTCSNLLKDGNILAISPGGVYEAQFSLHYNLMWKKRLGFAKVALDAKVVSLIFLISRHSNYEIQFMDSCISEGLSARLVCLFSF